MKKKQLAIALVLVGIASVGAFMAPFKQLELYGLYGVYEQGSGLDDDALAFADAHKARYRDTYLHLLNGAEPGSMAEKVAFAFADVFKGDAEIAQTIKHLASSAASKDSRCHWADEASNRFELERIQISERAKENANKMLGITTADRPSKNTFAAYRVVDNGSTCQ
ncbi:MAG: hypothetical protein VX447_09985 [Pseudomonadota bacterium]|uniref:hypothetical protein n=1 Tax=Gallaecimonas pentaromativorans TaxID=584787 RepID=UPI00067E7577|nr:hypothetical protein [Gallaecimonas pentaromativorans]MED5525068.1 hypothetical protein [Pseudomonadota bacterium]